MDTDAIAEYVTHVPPTLLVLSEKRKNGGHKATYKTPMWEEYNNTDTLSPWKFAGISSTSPRIPLKMMI